MALKQEASQTLANFIFYFFPFVQIGVPRINYFEEWLKFPKPTKNEQLFQFILSKRDLSGATENSLKDLKANISRVSAKLEERWKAAGCKKENFLKRNFEWLQGPEFMFNVLTEQSVPSSSTKSPQEHGPGRPQKDFSASSLKTKRRRVYDSVQSRTTNELLFAAEVSARASGRRNVAQAIKNVTDSKSTKDNRRNQRQIEQRRSFGLLHRLQIDHADVQDNSQDMHAETIEGISISV
ncbi:uncharacterized protein LOC133519486 [Cydia pomonella]|uniref:uncharacterized protein LOC133519486 n=1 Tax=Cydia pomonella TaxID=82600 RepID=UPI002ADDDD9B|nr:uncharacterized protein LOC133519486 [Cydia pomonella]